MSVLIFSFSLAAAYLLGSVAFGLIMARIHGVNIREVGSGNIGATNVFRSIGKGPGLLTFALDVLKGFIPAFYFPAAAALLDPGIDKQVLGISCGCAAVAGHNWPVFLGFKGGKGVATSAGMLLGIAPAAVGIGMGAWLVLFLLTGYVSLASILAAAAVAASGWLLYANAGPMLPLILTGISTAIIVKHRGNIQRLLQGTENRFDPLRRKKQ